MSQFPKLSKTITEKSGKTVNDAILAALDELGVTKDDVDVKVVDEGKKGFLGLGAKDATVRVSIKESVINAKNAAAREAKAKKAEAKAAAKEEKKAAAPKKPADLPPEKRSAPKKAEEKKPVEKKPVEMTAEKKEEAKKVFATPEVRNPKKTETPKKAEKPVEKAEEKKAEKPRRPKKVSDTPSDEVAQKFLTDIFAAMQLDIKVSAQMTGEDSLLVNLDGDNMGIVIGKRGDTLDSLQYLTSLVVNQQSEDYIKVTIDTENYREKRTEALIALSSRLAEKVAKTGKKFTLEPMNPYERRVIHSNLQDHEVVTTFSVGTEPYRKVVIAPKERKAYRKSGYRKNNRKSNAVAAEEVTAEKKGSYTTTYKADFKPQQHKAEFENFEAYLEAHKND